MVQNLVSIIIHIKGRVGQVPLFVRFPPYLEMKKGYYCIRSVSVQSIGCSSLR